MLAHHLAFVDLDTWDGGAEPHALPGIELNLPQLLDVLQIDDELGTPHAARIWMRRSVPPHQWTRFLAMAFQHRHRLRDGGRDFVVNFVQRRKPSKSSY